MFKKLLQLKTLLIALFVMTGAGNVWAETVTFDPSDFSGQGTSGTGSAISAAIDGVTFACDKGYGTTTHFRCYSGAKITISSSKTITAISFTFSGTYDGELETSYKGLSATTWEKKLGSQARITEVTVTYTTSGSVAPSINAENLSIAYGATSGNIDYTISNDVEGGGLTADITDGDWLTLGVVTSETVPFTCSANDGDADRTATVKLTYTYNTNQTVTKVVTITQAHPDYATLPFEWEGGASSALTKLNGVTASGLGSDYAATNAPYYVKLDGTDDYIQVKTDSQPGTVTIGVKMIGGANTSTITVQESADGDKFTDVEELSISGSQNAELTLETSNPFATNSRYVRLFFTKGSNVGVGPITIAKPSTDPAIDADSNVELAAEDTSGEIAYKIANPVGGTSLTATSSESWLILGTVTATEVPFTCTANEANTERTATVTLTYRYGDNETVTKVVTVTQAAYVDPNAKYNWVLTDLESLTSGDVFVIVGYNGDTYALSNNNGASAAPEAVEVTIVNNTLNAPEDKLKWNISGNAEDGYTFYPNGSTGTWLYCTNTNNGVRVGTNDDNKTFTVIDDYLYNTATSRYIGVYNSKDWRCYTSINANISNQKFAFYKQVPVTDKTVMIDDEHYATLYHGTNLKIPSGVVAKTVTVDDEGILTVEDISGSVIPALTGVLLYAAESDNTEYTFNGTDDYNSVDITDNNLTGVLTNQTVSEDGYVFFKLADGDDGLGFYYDNEGGTSINAKAGKAFLRVSKEQAPGIRGFVLSDAKTGIAEFTMQKKQREAYDLQGRRVSTPKNGLYIINGKKVFVK